jgi:hypothetical protein
MVVVDRPPLRAAAVPAAIGVAVAVVGAIVSPWLALMGVMVVLVSPIVLLASAIRHPPRRRYDAVGDDMAAMIERAGRPDRPRRPRPPDRGAPPRRVRRRDRT